MKVALAKLNPEDLDDFVNLIKVFEDVFEWEDFSFPPKNHLQKLLSKQNPLVFVAKVDNKIVGGLTAHILDRYDSEKPSAYIYDLAVLYLFQRKGFLTAIKNLNKFIHY